MYTKNNQLISILYFLIAPFKNKNILCIKLDDCIISIKVNKIFVNQVHLALNMYWEYRMMTAMIALWKAEYFHEYSSFSQDCLITSTTWCVAIFTYGFPGSSFSSCTLGRYIVPCSSKTVTTVENFDMRYRGQLQTNRKLSKQKLNHSPLGSNRDSLSFWEKFQHLALLNLIFPCPGSL